MDSFLNKVVLITGASGALGRAAAVQFAKSGFSVGVHYHKNRAAAEETKALVEASGQEAELFQADAADSAALKTLAAALQKKWGRLDVLVNNAGMADDAPVANLSDEAWNRVLSVNLSGPFYMTRAALPLLRESQGSVIMMSSYAGLKGARGAANYAAAKAGLVALAKSLAIEEGPNNVRVNVILPGYHVTDLNRGMFARFETIIRKKHLLKTMPTKAAFAAFLVQVAMLETVTGQVFPFESRLL